MTRGRAATWWRVVGVVLALSACVRFPLRFTTPCGLQVHGFTDGGLPPQWTPATLAEAETRTIYMLERYATDPRAHDACRLWNGWHVHPEPQPTFVEFYSQQRVAGLTECENRKVIVGSGDPRRYALPHELLHAMQMCVAPLPVDPGQDAYHANWTRDGLQKTVDYLETWRDDCGAGDFNQHVSELNRSR